MFVVLEVELCCANGWSSDPSFNMLIKYARYDVWAVKIETSTLCMEGTKNIRL